MQLIGHISQKIKQNRGEMVKQMKSSLSFSLESYTALEFPGKKTAFCYIRNGICGLK